MSNSGVPSHEGFKLIFRKWHTIPSWSWNGTDVCAVCHNSLDDVSGDSKFPGDASAAVWGVCKHAFHTACIQKCIDQTQNNSSSPRCPVCRQKWDFKENTT